jgi:hypothetical protein
VAAENPITAFVFIVLPAIAAGVSSYLVSWIYQRLRTDHSSDRKAASYIAALSALMGGICSYYRITVLGRSLVNNLLVMSFVGGICTLFWFLIRRHMVGMRD